MLHTWINTSVRIRGTDGNTSRQERGLYRLEVVGIEAWLDLPGNKRTACVCSRGPALRTKHVTSSASLVCVISIRAQSLDTIKAPWGDLPLDGFWPSGCGSLGVRVHLCFPTCLFNATVRRPSDRALRAFWSFRLDLASDIHA